MGLGPLIPLVPNPLEPNLATANPLFIWNSATTRMFTATPNLFPAGNLPPAKFLILHFRVIGNAIVNGEKLTVDLNNGQSDEFDTASGADFWTRPVKGNSAAITLSGPAGGAATSCVCLVEVAYGHVTDIFAHNAANIPPNTNAGMKDNRGVNPITADPEWEPISAAVADNPALFRPIADSVGMLLYVRAAFSQAATNNPDPTENSPIPSDPLCPDKRKKVIGHATGAMFDTEMLITAAHASMTPADPPINGVIDFSKGFLEARSGSFTPNYEDTINGDVRFYKLKDHVKHGYQFNPSGQTSTDIDNTIDYVVLELRRPALPDALPPALSSLTTSLQANDEIFIIHHPRARTKKISRPKAGGQQCQIFIAGNTPHDRFWFYDCDCDAGSSGATIFNMAAGKIGGLVVNVVTPAAVINLELFNRGPRIQNIVRDFQNPGFAVKGLEIVVVVDTSGSMGLLGASGIKTKMQEAKDAVSLFLSLLRMTPTNNVDPGVHHVSAVTFNTQALTNQQLALFNLALRNNLIGSQPPFNGGIVSGFSEGGLTSIGDGLQKALDQLNSPGVNKPRHILLMTDGMQNTRPMIADVQGNLTNTRLDAIGFGRPGDLDGALLSQLANQHGGTYGNAMDGLDLKKYYALIYGNIFESGNPLDPIHTLDPGQSTTDPIEFSLYGDQAMTVVVGWEHDDANLQLTLTSPSGNTITSSSRDVDTTYGNSWLHMRFDLPYNREQNGIWKAQVERKGTRPLRFRAHDAQVTCVTFSPIAPMALSGASNSSLFLWDVYTGKAIRGLYIDQMDEKPFGIAAAAYHPDGRQALTALRDGRLILWDTLTGQPLDTYRSEARTVPWSSVAFSPTGNLAVAGSLQTVEVLQIEAGKLVPERTLGDIPNALCAFSPDGAQVAIGSNGSLFIVDTSTWQPVQKFQTDTASSFTYTPDGRYLLVGHFKGEIGLYDPVTGAAVLMVNTGREEVVSAVACSPTGQYALSGSSADSEERPPLLALWKLPELELIRALEGHEGDINGVAFSPDGELALSASDDTTLIPWRIPAGEPAFGPLDTAERFFINTTANSQIYMYRFMGETPHFYYTGDTLYPQVVFRYSSGARVEPVEMKLQIEAPDNSTGNILMQRRDGQLVTPISIRGDALSARASTLLTLQQESTIPLVGQHISTHDLFDDGHHFDGAMEPDGIFGQAIPDILHHEGHYTLRARAHYGDQFEGMREVTWTLYVGIGIDPDQSQVTVSAPSVLPDGRQRSTVRFMPRDKYGNYLGSGLDKTFTVEAAPGAALQGDLKDIGGGQYSQDVIWDAGRNDQPAILIAQPGRPAVRIGQSPPPYQPKEKSLIRFCSDLLRLISDIIVKLVVRLRKR